MTQVFEPSNHAIANKVLAGVVMLLLLTSGSTLVLGTKTGELDKKIIQPLKNNTRYLLEALSTPDQPTPEVTNTNNVNSDSSSSTDVEVNTTNDANYPPPRQQQPTWSLPIYNTPTPNPTAIEWERQFKEKQAELQREYDESKQQVCAAMPDAPGCH